jgi:predicted RNase H-like HicB family nuclease
MLTEYIRAAMHHARYEIIEDEGTYFGYIPECKGLWANESTLEACRDELQEALEDWIVLSLTRNIPVPVIDGIDLSFHAVPDEA